MYIRLQLICFILDLLYNTNPFVVFFPTKKVSDCFTLLSSDIKLDGPYCFAAARFQRKIVKGKAYRPSIGNNDNYFNDI